MQEDRAGEFEQSATKASRSVMRELLWVSTLAHLTDKTGAHFLPLVASGIYDVAVHLKCSAETEHLLRDAAMREGRTGWSSTALSQHLASQIVLAFSEKRLGCSTTRAHLNVGPEMASTIAHVLENDQISLQEATEKEHEKGHAAALYAARLLHLKGMIELAEKGTDIRWAVMREVMERIGDIAGYGKPKIVKRAHFEIRPSPDMNAIGAEQAILKARSVLILVSADALAGFDLTAVGIARMYPRGKAWSGVVMSAQLPGTEVMYCAWNVDSNRIVDG